MVPVPLVWGPAGLRWDPDPTEMLCHTHYTHPEDSESQNTSGPRASGEGWGTSTTTPFYRQEAEAESLISTSVRRGAGVTGITPVTAWSPEDSPMAAGS